MVESPDELDGEIESVGGVIVKGQQNFPPEMCDSSTCCDDNARLTSNHGIMGSKSNTCNCRYQAQLQSCQLGNQLTTTSILCMSLKSERDNITQPVISSPKYNRGGSSALSA